MREFKCRRIIDGRLSDWVLSIMGATSFGDAAEQAADYFDAENAEIEGRGRLDTKQNICVEDDAGAVANFEVVGLVNVKYTAECISIKSEPTHG